MNGKCGSCMCRPLTRFLLKIGAIEPLCYPLQIRTTNKGDSTGPYFPKGVVSENVLLSEPLRLPDLKIAPDFRKGLLHKKWCYGTAVVSIANTDNKQGRFESINSSEGCRFSYHPPPPRPTPAVAWCGCGLLPPSLWCDVVRGWVCLGWLSPFPL